MASSTHPHNIKKQKNADISRHRHDENRWLQPPKHWSMWCFQPFSVSHCCHLTTYPAKDTYRWTSCSSQSWFHSWYDSFHLIQSWLKLQRWHFYMIPNDIEWWISVNPICDSYCNHSEWDNLIFQYIPMTERGSENCQCSTLIHTLVYWYLLLLKQRIWERQFLDMNQQSLWQRLPMIDIETHQECCLGTSMFTVSHGSIVLQTHAKIHELFSQVCQLKRFIWLHGTPHQRCQTELCPSHQSHLSMDPRSTNDQKAQFSCRSSSGLMPPPIDGCDGCGHLENTEPPATFRPVFGGTKATCILCAVGWQFLVGAVRPIWPRKPRSSFPWLWVMPYKTLKIHDSFLNHLKLVAKRGWDNIQNQSWSCSTKRFGIPRHSDHIFGMPLWTLRKLQVLEDFKVWLGFVFANQTKRDSKT